MTKGLSNVAVAGAIRRKINDWLSTIEDKELVKFVSDKIVVAGGSLTSMMMGTRVNDYDVYVTTPEAAMRLAYYYLERFAKHPSQTLRGDKTRMWVDIVTTRAGVDERWRVDKGCNEARRYKLEGKHMDGKLNVPLSYFNQGFESVRVNVVVKSAGVAGIIETEAGTEGYAYFESVPDPERAISYVQQQTQHLGFDSEAALAAQLCDTDCQTIAEGPGQQDLMTELATQYVKDMLPTKELGRGANNKYRPVFCSSNAITLSDGVQLVLRFTGTGEEIIKNFDFVHTTCYWESGSVHAETSGLTLNMEAVRSMQSMKLKYVGSRYPLCTLVRTRKFVERGWKAPASVFIKAMWQCRSLDWDKIETWEDQLTGMDTAYFSQILCQLKKDKEAGITVDGIYVVELIDRMM